MNFVNLEFIKQDQLQTVQFGKNYSAGLYNVVVTQGEETKIIKIIKK